MRNAIRRGTVLIVATGLAAMMLSLATAFVVSMRNESGRSQALTQDVRCRLMLHAAKCYILESSRLGWGDVETMGWNDVRNHAVGPIPIDRAPLPANAVWSAGTWPAPGSVARCPIYRQVRPRFAVRPGPLNTFSDDVNAAGTAVAIRDLYKQLAWPLAPDPAPVVPLTDPRFVTAFNAGDPSPVPGSEFQCWFRIYRETPADHDGDGSPYFDVIDLNGGSPIDGAARPPNASVFIVTVGAGASLGFRDWAEVQASGMSDTFGASAEFNQIRSLETIRWFRLEWSPYDNKGLGQGLRKVQSPSQSSIECYYPAIHPFGHIRWVQRLDREPPSW